MRDSRKIKQFGIVCGLSFVLGSARYGLAENYAAIVTKSNDSSENHRSSLYYVPIDDNGSFGNKVEIYDPWAHSNSHSVGVADFDGDGDKDIIFAHGANGKLILIRKQGPGPDFASRVGKGQYISHGYGFYGAEDMAVADFNGDKNMDFALSGHNDLLQVYLGNGDGTFYKLYPELEDIPQLPSPYPLPLGGIMRGKDAADINCDGVMDLVTAVQHRGHYNFDYGELYVWLGRIDSENKFSFDPPISVYSTRDSPATENLFGYGVVIDNYISGPPDPSNPHKEKLEILVTVDVEDTNGNSYSSLNMLSRSSVDCANIDFDVVTPVVDLTSPAKHLLFMDGLSLGENSVPGVLYSLGREYYRSDAYSAELECNGETCTSDIKDAIGLEGGNAGTTQVCAVATPRELCTDGDNDGSYINCGDVTDCNDTDAAIYPGAEEVCDGADNDCDGSIDNIYLFDGFRQPIKNTGLENPTTFKLGRTIPIKFGLTDCAGNNVAGAAVAFSFVKQNGAESSADPIYPDVVENPDSGNFFRYDATDAQYIYNLSTKGETVGEYMVYALMDNDQVFSVLIALK